MLAEEDGWGSRVWHCWCCPGWAVFHWTALRCQCDIQGAAVGRNDSSLDADLADPSYAVPHSGCTHSNGAMWRRSRSLQLSACAPRSGPVAPVVSALLLLHDAVLQQDQLCVLFPGSGIILLLPVQHQAWSNTEWFWARRSGPTAWTP